MTPQERAVIEAAKMWQEEDPNDGWQKPTPAETALGDALDNLPETLPPTITIWRFEDAPAAYRDEYHYLVEDAAWLMHVPLGCEVPDWIRNVPSEQWLVTTAKEDATLYIFADR